MYEKWLKRLLNFVLSFLRSTSLKILRHSQLS